MRERERLKVFGRVEGGELKVIEAADILGTSYRQCQRLWAKYRAEGDEGLVHGLRGKPSNRGARVELREAVLKRYKERYPDFGPTFAAEKLALEGLVVDHETLRRWLMAAEIWEKKRKRSVHKSWRERKPHFGELLQLDGSDHDWFEGRCERCFLMNLVDDATNTRLALFSPEETTDAALTLLWRWIELYGIPQAIYTDRKSVYYVVDEKSRERAYDEGREALTQFGRVCKLLGIRLIIASSPQAKGRVERGHRIYQDRLVKELRLGLIDCLGEANAFLANGYMDELNRKFTYEPAESADYHRSREGFDLAAIFAIEDERSITADWIVRFENRFFQLKPLNKRLRGNGKVKVRRRLDESLHFYLRDQELAFQELPERPQPVSRKKPHKARSQTMAAKSIPPPDHPWRRFVINPPPPKL